MAARDLTASRLREILRYTPETGEFTWLSDGKLAGGIRGHSYLRIGVDGCRYYAHRLAFLYMTGRWPLVVDHINGRHSDNRWGNLREVAQRQNVENRRVARADNVSTGILGVSKRACCRPMAKIRVRGKEFFIGAFDSIEDAHAAYLVAKTVLHAGAVTNLDRAKCEVELSNLRNAPRIGNKVGFRGVHLHKPGVYRARIMVDGKNIHLGCFDTPEKAHDAYIAARSSLTPK